METLQSPLPVHNMAAAKDFVRLHPDEENYWSAELCFMDVPIKGQKHNTLHLIDEDLALQFLEAGEIKRFRLALATKPDDVFLPLRGSHAEPRQQLEQYESGGVRESQDALDEGH